MTSRSSRPSTNSSRSSNTSRDTPHYADLHRVPPMVPYPPVANHLQPHRQVRFARDILEEIEAYNLQIAHTEASRQHALNALRDAESNERILTEARNRAQQRLDSNALVSNHGSRPAVVLDRTPNDYDMVSTTSNSKTSKPAKSKRPHYEVVAIRRPVRPKTIWGTPAWP